MPNWSAIGAMIFPNIGGWAGALTMAGQTKQPDGKAWYQTLKKPSWTPPNWAFGPAWTTLYTGMGYASYMVYRDCGGLTDKAILPMALYGGHLILNWTWTPIFFRMHLIRLVRFKNKLVLCMFSAWNAIFDFWVWFLGFCLSCGQKLPAWVHVGHSEVPSRLNLEKPNWGSTSSLLKTTAIIELLTFQAFYHITALDAAAAACALTFYQVNPNTAWLMLPYLAWLSFATCLNYSIWQLNKKDSDK